MMFPAWPGIPHMPSRWYAEPPVLADNAGGLWLPGGGPSLCFAHPVRDHRLARPGILLIEATARLAPSLSRRMRPLTMWLCTSCLQHNTDKAARIVGESLQGKARSPVAGQGSTGKRAPEDR